MLGATEFRKQTSGKEELQVSELLRTNSDVQKYLCRVDSEVVL